MTFKLLYIDDEIQRPNRDANYIKSKLELPGEFEIDLKPPPKQLPGADLDQNYDALLIDQDLTTAVVDDQSISYYGGTYATESRMRFPARPIILISKENIITSYHQQIELLEESIIDLTLDKDQVITEPEKIRHKLENLIKGYQALSAIQPAKHSWSDVLSLMEANETEAKLLRETAAPSERGNWTVPQVTRWIREVVLRYPGIVYNELTAATRLGLSLGSFQRPQVQEWFKPACYTGIFGQDEPFWWRNRLFHRAQELLLEVNLSGPVSEYFIKAYQQQFKQELQPAICIYDHTPGADWVCHILKEPVKVQNSVPYYPDSRPEIMDQARVSFKAVLERNEFDVNLVDADSYELVVKPLLEKN